VMRDFRIQWKPLKIEVRSIAHIYLDAMNRIAFSSLRPQSFKSNGSTMAATCGGWCRVSEDRGPARIP
jgi:hypothetical protein